MGDKVDEGDPKPPSIVPQPAGAPSRPAFEASARVVKKSRATRQQIAVACLPCQKRKCRCDGKRPICSTCIQRGKMCEYNIDEGLTRSAHLKNREKTLEQSSKELQTVVDLLRKGSDSEAAAVLARLRVGNSITAIVEDAGPESTPSSARPQEPITPAASTQGIDPEFQVQSHHLRADRYFDRQDWGQSRGLPAFDPRFQEHSSSNSHHQVPQSRVFYEQPQSERINPQTQHTSPLAPRSTHPPPLMIGYHETNPNELVRLRNFGNMDFSSGILANNYPHQIQQGQLSNLYTPLWAKKSVPIVIDPTHPMALMTSAIDDVYRQAKQMLDSGIPMIDIAGPHPRMSVLLDDKEFERAPFLSQFAGRMVYSIKETNRELVCYASMYLFWWLMRWMLDPSPEAYSAMPEWLRPTPNQLFMPHMISCDFFAWPAFRDYVTRVPELLDRPEWIMDMSMNIACEWPGKIEDALAPSPVDGELDLTMEAMEFACNIDCWSLKPSFRKYLLDADRYINIKWDD